MLKKPEAYDMKRELTLERLINRLCHYCWGREGWCETWALIATAIAIGSAFYTYHDTFPEAGGVLCAAAIAVAAWCLGRYSGMSHSRRVAEKWVRLDRERRASQAQV